MAVTTPPIALQNAGATHTAEMLRNSLSGILVGARANTSMVPRGGVHPAIGGVMNVTQQASPAMGITVATGMCYVAGTEGTSQGAYACMNPTATDVTVTAAHASLPRIDIVVARVYDTIFSGALNQFSLEVIAGTPNASPSAPATPNNSLVLAQIAVGAAVTSIVNANITDKRPYIGQGIIPVATFADLPSVGLFDGMQAYVRAEDIIYSYNGSAWVRPYNLVKSFAETTASTSTSAIGSSHTVYTSISSTTYKANTAYKVELMGTYSLNTANAYGLFTVRKTDASSQVLADYQRTPVQVTSGLGVRYNYWSYFTVGGSDVTAVIVGCTNANTGTITITASSTALRSIRISEAGAAADYSSWPVLV